MTKVNTIFYSTEGKAELGKGSYATEAKTSEEFVKELEGISIFDIPGYPHGFNCRKLYLIAQVEGIGTALIHFVDA